MSRRAFTVRCNTRNQGGVHTPFHLRHTVVTWEVLVDFQGELVLQSVTLRGDQPLSSWCADRGLTLNVDCLVQRVG